MAERKLIDNKITEIVSKSYSKYGMSEVVKDDNPYSRLMALKKMGIVENYAVSLTPSRKSSRKAYWL